LPEVAPAIAAPPRVEISRVAPAPADGALAGFNLQHPVQGSSERGYSFPLAGFAVPAHTAPREIHLHGAQRRLPRVPVAIERPDVAALHPDVSWAGRAGFAARLSTVHLPRRFALALTLVLEDGTDVPLASIEGERPALPVYEHAAHRPLMITTLGRSGSTWLTWVLGQHPAIADYRSFEYEPKVAAYFAEAVRALSSPASSYQAIRGDIDNSGWWLGREPRWGLRWYSSHDSVDEWLATDHVEDLVAFFAGRIDALYARLAEALGKPDAAYVVEKLPPVFFAQRMMAEIFPGTREIFLVRDFRDVVCSIFAFGRKRGKKWYWERPWADDEQVVREFVRDEVDELLASWAERGEGALLLRYEDLVLDPERALAEVCSHLGVDARPETVARVLADAARLDGRMWDVHSTSPTPERSIGRWREELTPALRRACEEALGEGLETFGYA
jgi:LPS sulfotransferase NodH